MKTNDTPLRPDRELTVGRRPLAMMFAVLALSSVVYFFTTAEQHFVVIPAVISIIAVSWAFAVLWNRDGIVPFFDVGMFCIAVTGIYITIPLVKFLLTGMQWTTISDSRIYMYDPSPEEYGGFFRLHVAYLVPLVVTYVWARGRGAAKPDRPVAATAPIILLFVWLTVFIGLYIFAIESFFNVNLRPSHQENIQAIGDIGLGQFPLVVQQVTHHLVGILQILKMGLVIILVSNWRKPVWRYVLFVWLGAEVAMTLVRQGQRTELVFMFLSAALAYHRLVRPIKFTALVGFVLIMLVGTIAYGYLRQFGALQVEGQNLLSAATEFDILVGTAFHLHKLKESGLLPEVPWQVFASDPLMVIPQQLLPFVKWDPSEWYLEIIGARNTGVGLMFGVVAQGVIGFGALEMVIRGAVLGLLLALIHRWYVSRAPSFWATLFYLFLILVSYYTYRATTFYAVAFVFYRFLPMFVLVEAGRLLLTGSVRERTGVGA